MEFFSNGFNLLLIVIGFGVLIFVHELGHFLAAKWAGVRTEAFAVGMGPVVLAWRKGIGLVAGSTHGRVVAKAGKPAAELNDTELERHGLGETEYSLRWLPIGGFVKMLGQEDVNPNYVSDDPRSYNMCPVGKRMVVVSAGVIMNVILAAVLFVVAFMIGVRFEAAVVGDVVPSLPAATTRAANADSAGIDSVGLSAADLVVDIDGKPCRTFADLQIASAMSKPGDMLVVTVEREGVDQQLVFELLPVKDPMTGLLSIGVAPASSNVLASVDSEAYLEQLASLGLTGAGVRPGMQLVQAGDLEIRAYEQFHQQVDASGGHPVATEWQAFGDDGLPTGPRVAAQVQVKPLFETLLYPSSGAERVHHAEEGLLGMTPLVKILALSTKLNEDVLQVDDVILRAGNADAPRIAEFRREIAARAKGHIDLLVLRDGETVKVEADVDRNGHLNVIPGYAWELPLMTHPMERVRPSLDPDDADVTFETPVAALRLPGRTRIEAVGGVAINDWADIRRELRAQTQDALERDEGATVQLAVTHPTPDADRVELTLTLDAATIARLHELGWDTDLRAGYFDPIYTELAAGGNPVRAVAMGLEETHKLIVMTYLTIDRLFRGSVGVEQLRGPVGIVHLGTRIADRGFTYLIFFLAMISVNLAVINFLPLPIVDGGLFLFLIYERFKGRPPSLAFQNAATIAGLFLIGTAFVVTFYNDVVRLLG